MMTSNRWISRLNDQVTIQIFLAKYILQEYSMWNNSEWFRILELSPIPEKNKDPFDKIQELETVSSTGESL